MKRAKSAGAVPLVNPITITKFTARYPLTKTLTLSEDGKIEPSFKGLGRGSISRLSVTSKQLLNELISIGPNDCWCFGRPIDNGAINVISRPEFEATSPPVGTITRTKEQFAWPVGPAILMIDYDPAKHQLSQKRLLAILYGVCPALRNTAHIWAASSSSFIKNSKTGREIHGLRGQRIYIAVANGADIDRASNALIKNLWLAGHGHIAVSKVGKLLTRCVIDVNVFQPTRIDFCAPANCKSPLKQRKPTPVLLGNDLLCLDTEVALPNLTQGELARYEQLVREEKSRMQGAADAIESTAIKEWTEKLVTNGVEQDVAERTVRAALETQILYADFVLTASDGTKLTVGDLLANKKKYHGIELRDPLEPDYRDDNRIAKAFLMGRRPIIYSFAHGECTYELRDARQTIALVPGDRATSVSEIANFFNAREMFFRCCGELVAVDEDGLTSIQDQWTMQAELDRSFLFQQPRKTGLMNIDAPENLAKLIVRGHRSNFPKVHRVVTAPTISPASGRLIYEPGYDVETKLFLDLPTPYPPVPEKPSKKEIERALELLSTLFSGFNFVEPIDISTFFAALLTAVVRPLLESAPGFGFSAPTQGSGKSTLMRIVMAIGGSSKAMSGQPDTENDEELRKRILTILMENSGAIVIDNIVGMFDSKTLASVMTSPLFKDRVLGVSKNAEVSTAAVVLLSGNNLMIKGDLLRRILVVRIDTGMERPYERSFDCDPVRVVTARRSELVVAALTLIKAYMSRIDRSRPCEGSSGFDEWDMFVREPICWIARMIKSKQIKAPDVFAALEDPRHAFGKAAAMDPFIANHGTLLRAWAAALGTGNTGGTRSTVKAAIDQLRDRHQAPNRIELNALHAALLVVASSRFNPSEIDTGKLGLYFSRQQGAIVGGFRVRAGPTKQNAVEWFVEKLSEGGEVGEAKNLQKKSAKVIPITAAKGKSLTTLTRLTGRASAERTKQTPKTAALRRGPSSKTITVKPRKK